MPKRRTLIAILPAVALAATSRSRADDTRVAETDPDAQGQHYVADAARIDRSKFPAYKPGQTCATCQLFDGSPKDAWGSCSLFLGKEVASGGWCQAWEKKA